MVILAMSALPPLLGWTLAHGLAYDKWQKWLPFCAVLMVALVPMIVRWPVVMTFGLYAFVATSIDAFPFLPGGATVGKPLGALTGAVLLGAGLIERRLGRPPMAALWWGGFMLWASLTTIWALDPDVSLQRLPSVLSLFVLYLAAASFQPSRREFKLVCALTVLGGLLAASLAYFFGMQEEAANQVNRGRLALGDMDSDPNTLGRVLVLPLALAVAAFIRSGGMLLRMLAAGSAALIGLGIFISMSRGAIVSIVTMFLVMLYRMRVRWHLLVVIVVLLVVAMFMPSALYERFDALVSGQDDGSHRLEIWRTGLRMLDQSGIFGAGLYNFPRLYASYAGGQVAAHNIYLSSLIDLGIPGLAMLLAAIATTLLAVWKVTRAAPASTDLSALEAACIGTLTSGLFFENIFTKSFWLVWMLLTWAVYIETRSDDGSGASVRG
jgi:O-antigen ligase